MKSIASLMLFFTVISGIDFFIGGVIWTIKNSPEVSMERFFWTTVSFGLAGIISAILSDKGDAK